MEKEKYRCRETVDFFTSKTDREAKGTKNI